MKSILRISLIMLLAVMFSNTAFSQDKSKRASPAMTSEATIGEANVSVAYSSPAVKGRTIWGDLVPYDKIWRAGANEATTFETDKPIKVQGQDLAAGKYSVFVVPTASEWTIVFNSVAAQWGAYEYSSEKDILRVTTTPVATASMAERLAINVGDSGLSIAWDKMSGTVTLE